MVEEVLAANSEAIKSIDSEIEKFTLVKISQNWKHQKMLQTKQFSEKRVLEEGKGADTTIEDIANMIANADTFILKESAKTMKIIKNVKEKNVRKNIPEDVSGNKVKKGAKEI